MIASRWGDDPFDSHNPAFNQKAQGIMRRVAVSKHGGVPDSFRAQSPHQVVSEHHAQKTGKFGIQFCQIEAQAFNMAKPVRLPLYPHPLQSKRSQMVEVLFEKLGSGDHLLTQAKLVLPRAHSARCSPAACVGLMFQNSPISGGFSVDFLFCSQYCSIRLSASAL